MRQDFPLPPTQDNTAFELRVLEGPQRGARTPLSHAADWLIRVGPEFTPASADLVLLGCQTASLQLHRDAVRGVRLTLVEGEARLAGMALQPGVDLAWPAGALLQVGDTEMAYGPAHEAQWTVPPHQDATEGPSGAAPGSDTRPPPGPRRRDDPRWPTYLAAAGVVLVGISAGLGALTSLIPAHASASATAGNAAAPKRSARDNEEAVAEVFRLHGLKARVAQGAGGRIEVTTQTADLPLLARAEAAVRRDLPGAPALQVVNQPPARGPAAPSLHHDPGKRITAVVTDEELPYVVTADGSRYFTGAVLPSGHRVIAIVERQVKVELDGHATELSL